MLSLNSFIELNSIDGLDFSIFMFDHFFDLIALIVHFRTHFCIDAIFELFDSYVIVER